VLHQPVLLSLLQQLTFDPTALAHGLQQRLPVLREALVDIDGNDPITRRFGADVLRRVCESMRAAAASNPAAAATTEFALALRSADQLVAMLSRGL
jgi:hypothetical protein